MIRAMSARYLEVTPSRVVRDAVEAELATLATTRDDLLAALRPAAIDSRADRATANSAENAASMREAGENLPAGRIVSLAEVLSEMDEQSDQPA